MDANENGKTACDTAIATVEDCAHIQNTNAPKLTALVLAKTTQARVTRVSWQKIIMRQQKENK